MYPLDMPVWSTPYGRKTTFCGWPHQLKIRSKQIWTVWSLTWLWTWVNFMCKTYYLRYIQFCCRLANTHILFVKEKEIVTPTVGVQHILQYIYYWFHLTFMVTLTVKLSQMSNNTIIITGVQLTCLQKLHHC